MSEFIPEIALLLQEVEKKYGRKVNTSTDFESLSVLIEHEIGEYISSSTLKRLWGYVSLKPKPRIATLDVLCRYVGRASFADFREELKRMPGVNSDFFTTHVVSSADLKVGDKIVIGWKPNRLVTLVYKGDDKFCVVESENAKLRKGDEFNATQFMLGYPLFIDRILRPEGPTPAFVAGKVSGLNRLEKI